MSESSEKPPARYSANNQQPGPPNKWPFFIVYKYIYLSDTRRKIQGRNDIYVFREGAQGLAKVSLRSALMLDFARKKPSRSCWARHSMENSRAKKPDTWPGFLRQISLIFFDFIVFSGCFMLEPIRSFCCVHVHY